MKVRGKKFGWGAVGAVALCGLITYFAVSFSCQGFLEVGSDLTRNVDTWPLLGWLIQAILIIPNPQFVGFGLGAFILLKCLKAKGVSKGNGALLLLSLLLIGGAETLNNNVGAIAGFCLFLWFNAVQLSSWAGQINGFNASWARELKPYIVFFYIAEIVINIMRFPPYADGSRVAFFEDLQYGVLDPNQIQYGNLLWMVVSVAAVEATVVFFIKYSAAVRRQLGSKSQSARPPQSPQSAAYSRAPQGGRRV